MCHIRFKIVLESFVMAQSCLQKSEIDMCLDCVGSMKFICCWSVPLMKLLWCKQNIKYLFVYVPEQSQSFDVGKLDVSLEKHWEINTSHVV